MPKTARPALFQWPEYPESVLAHNKTRKWEQLKKVHGLKTSVCFVSFNKKRWAKLGQMQPYWVFFSFSALLLDVCPYQAGSIVSCINVVSLFLTHLWHYAAEQAMQMEGKKREFLISLFILALALSFHTVLLNPYCGVLPRHNKQTCLKAGSFPKPTKNICMTYEMSAADLPKHLCYDGYLTSDNDLSVVIWPLCIWGRGQGKDHSFGLCMDHWGTVGLLSVCRILLQNETFYFSNLVK